jgi:nucleoside phosphorylase
VEQGTLSNSGIDLSGNTFTGPVAMSATGPVTQTVQAAAQDKRDGAGNRLTVGVLVALDEEFRHYQTVFSQDSVVEPGRDGSANHLRRFEWPDARPLTLVSRVIGRPGPEHASVAAAQLLADFSPGFLVSIGISGAVSSELGLSDIVIGETVTGYLANSKIVDVDGAEGYQLSPAGEPYRADKWLCDRAGGLADEAPQLYERWRLGALAVRRRAIPPQQVPTVKIVRGHLASGPSVVSSSAFKQWLLRHKRDYLAVDMESSGAATAVWSTPLANVRLLILRGISDLADGDKSRLERETDGQVRAVAMICTARYLEAVLHHVATYR